MRFGAVTDVLALSQGALLTREDLAYRVFFVSPRTISRDLNILRRTTPGLMIPLRSTVHDNGQEPSATSRGMKATRRRASIPGGVLRCSQSDSCILTLHKPVVSEDA